MASSPGGGASGTHGAGQAARNEDSHNSAAPDHALGLDQSSMLVTPRARPRPPRIHDARRRALDEGSPLSRSRVSSNDSAAAGSAANYSYDAYGRPLSTIESVISDASSSAGESGGHEEVDEETSDGRIERQRLSTPTTSLQEVEDMDTRDSTDTVTHGDEQLEAQIASLLETFAPAKDGNDKDATKSIKLADLPALLAAFEECNGVKLLEDDMHPQIKAFAAENAEVSVEPEQVVAVIRQLQEASKGRTDRLAEGRSSPASGAVKPRKAVRPATDSSELDTTSSDSESQEEEENRADNEEHTLRSGSPSSRRGVAFPRSSSERSGFSRHVSHSSYSSPSKAGRQPTLSDPATPNAKHRKGNEQASGEKEVLKGKGKIRAPPSAWMRPKPQALAGRSRKSSDGSPSSSFENGEYATGGLTSPASDSPRSAVLNLTGMRSPSERIVSIPTYASLDSAMAQLPNSPNSPFSFPRAQSPQADDINDVEAQERWNSLTEDLQGRRSGHTSPQHDGTGNSTQGLVTPSPAKRRPTGSRRSSGARRGGIDEHALPGETKASLQAQVEGLQRLLAEKRHDFEQTQHETEEYISRLQEELDRIKSDYSLKRKEEALSRIRENNHLDVIAGLEADLTKANGELETIKTQYTRIKSDYDELVGAMERQTSRNIEMRQELERANEQMAEHGELGTQWEDDRETYRDSIKKLNEEIAELQQTLLGREEDARVIASMQANIDALSSELEEVRNRGNAVSDRRSATSSAYSTLSRRLGAELERSHEAQRQREAAGLEQEAAEEDESADSILLIRRRKRSGASQGKDPVEALDLVDEEAQTEDTPPSEGPSTPHARHEQLPRSQAEEGAPPTYDQASMEKSLTQRLHPTATDVESASRNSPAYQMLVRRLGLRCLHLEERLRHAAETSEERPSADYRQQLRRLASSLQAAIKHPRSTWHTLSQSDWRNIKAVGLRLSTANDFEALLLRSVVVFVIGLVLGALLFGFGNHLPEDLAAWHYSNALEVPWTLDFAPNGRSSPAGKEIFSRLGFGRTGSSEAHRLPT